MILYFSATGNCKYVAEQIAEATGDAAVSIEKRKSSIELGEGEILGIVSPTYSWELPIIVQSLQFSTGRIRRSMGSIRIRMCGYEKGEKLA